MKILKFLFPIPLIACAIFASAHLTGCATAQTPTTSVLQTAINDAWTAANKYQTLNNGQLITPSQQATVLAVSHNTDDATWASIVTAIGNQLGGAVIAAQAAKVSPVAASNAVLAPSNVATIATAVVDPGAITPVTTTFIEPLVPHSMLSLSPGEFASTSR